jgi:flavin reductase (DIM6/NTAB) family NADH-FMN oxidoreductase RutF
MSSVSADTQTPSLLVCVHHKSSAARAIEKNGIFCVNVLGDDQAALSDTFAGRLSTAGGDKFERGDWRVLASGAPMLGDCLVAFDCELRQHLRWGTHHIFIGEIADIIVREARAPLIYANRAYGTLVPLKTVL